MKRTFGVLAMVVIALAAPRAEAGVIRGQLLLSAGAAHAAEKNDRQTLARTQHGVTDAVVYLERIPDKVERKLTGHGWFFTLGRPPLPRIIQSHMRFVPRVMPVAAGTAVRFENLDRVYHSAFSVSAAKRFDLGKYPPGRVDTVMFDRAGVVNLHCDIHPEMSGYIVVVPNHAYTRPDSMGSFALPKLPPGNYTVHAWLPQFGELTAKVEMPRHGNSGLKMAY